MAAEKNTESGSPLPGSEPNSRANLNPWKPGESGSPAGRPKGSHNIRTILNETFNRYVDVEALKHLGGREAMVVSQFGVNRGFLADPRLDLTGPVW
jgi:hypothetical protein